MVLLGVAIPSLLKGDIPCESGVIARRWSTKKVTGQCQWLFDSDEGQSSKIDCTTAFPVVENGGGDLVYESGGVIRDDTRGKRHACDVERAGGKDNVEGR